MPGSFCPSRGYIVLRDHFMPRVLLWVACGVIVFACCASPRCAPFLSQCLSRCFAATSVAALGMGVWMCHLRAWHEHAVWDSERVCMCAWPLDEACNITLRTLLHPV